MKNTQIHNQYVYMIGYILQYKKIHQIILKIINNNNINIYKLIIINILVNIKILINKLIFIVIIINYLDI